MWMNFLTFSQRSAVHDIKFARTLLHQFRSLHRFFLHVLLVDLQLIQRDDGATEIP